MTTVSFPVLGIGIMSPSDNPGFLVRILTRPDSNGKIVVLTDDNQIWTVSAGVVTLTTSMNYNRAYVGVRYNDSVKSEPWVRFEMEEDGNTTTGRSRSPRRKSSLGRSSPSHGRRAKPGRSRLKRN